MECIRKIKGMSMNIYGIKESKTQALPSAAPHWVCVSDFYTINMYKYFVHT